MDPAGNQSQAGGDSLRDGPVLPGIVIAPAHPAHERTGIVFEVLPGTEGTDVLDLGYPLAVLAAAVVFLFCPAIILVMFLMSLMPGPLAARPWMAERLRERVHGAPAG